VHGNLVYVLSARDGGSVQGFLRVGDTLIRMPAWHRSLGLNPALTPEFTHTPGQVAFTPDGSELIVTTKSNGNDIDVFAVRPDGGISARPVVNPDAGNQPFSVTFDGGGHLVVAEGAPNTVATFALHGNGTVTVDNRVATGQQATCWITPDGTTFFAGNAGSGSVSGFSDNGSGTLRALGNTGTDPTPWTPPPPRTGPASTSRPAATGSWTSTRSTQAVRRPRSAPLRFRAPSAVRASPPPDPNRPSLPGSGPLNASPAGSGPRRAT
jgi:hypothetical protein